jgi:hypothetical protein
MKKIITIVMLILFLLNVLGFYGIFLGLQLKYAQEANRDLDEEHYAGMELVTFKVPLTVPYYADSKTYERVSGEFENDGDVYRLVKQKMHRDTLYIVCVKDLKSKKINQALASYVKTFTDKPSTAKQQNAKQFPSFCKDYLTSAVSVESQSSGWKNGIAYGEPEKSYPSSISSKIKYPPKHFFNL